MNYLSIPDMENFFSNEAHVRLTDFALLLGENGNIQAYWDGALHDVHFSRPLYVISLYQRSEVVENNRVYQVRLLYQVYLLDEDYTLWNVCISLHDDNTLRRWTVKNLNRNVICGDFSDVFCYWTDDRLFVSNIIVQWFPHELGLAFEKVKHFRATENIWLEGSTVVLLASTEDSTYMIGLSYNHTSTKYEIVSCQLILDHPCSGVSRHFSTGRHYLITNEGDTHLVDGSKVKYPWPVASLLPQLLVLTHDGDLYHESPEEHYVIVARDIQFFLTRIVKHSEYQHDRLIVLAQTSSGRLLLCHNETEGRFEQLELARPVEKVSLAGCFPKRQVKAALELGR